MNAASKVSGGLSESGQLLGAAQGFGYSTAVYLSGDEDPAAGVYSRQQRRWEGFYAAAALVGLCACTTVERVAFKMLVDRVVPFRYLLLVLVVAFDAAALTVVVLAKSCRGGNAPMPQGFPRRKLLAMAALDLVKDTMMMLTGAFVAPTLTVLLLQGQLPVGMLLGVLYSGAKGRGLSLGYRPMHYAGAGLISVALVAALLPVTVAEWLDVTSPNTVTYFFACVPAAASVLYKEKALTLYRMPVDPYVLNLWVDLYQLALLAVAAPLVFRLQSMGYFGHSQFDDDAARGNYAPGPATDGLQCFFDAGAVDPGPDPLLTGADVWPSPKLAYCQLALPLLATYVGASLLVNFTVDRVLRYGSGPLLYRAVTAASVSAWFVLGLLAHGAPTVKGTGLSIAVFEIPSVLLLAVGNELYHRFPEPGNEVLTQWAIPVASAQS
jgi:hypothetical protein